MNYQNELEQIDRDIRSLEDKLDDMYEVQGQILLALEKIKWDNAPKQLFIITSPFIDQIGQNS